jgi:hypothetical protein
MGRPVVVGDSGGWVDGVKRQPKMKLIRVGVIRWTTGGDSCHTLSIASRAKREEHE